MVASRLMRILMVVAAAALMLSVAAATTQTLAQPAVTIGIDTDPTGNQGLVLGAIENCRAVQPGDSFQVDVFTKGIPPASGFSDGLSGFALNLRYDPAVLKVTAINTDLMLSAAGPRNPFDVTDPLPDSDGNFRADEADLSRNFESGDGVLMRLTLQAVGTGLSSLILSDDIPPAPDGIPDVLGAAGNPKYQIATIQNAAIGVGQACTAPAPVFPATATPGPGATTGASGGPGATTGASGGPGGTSSAAPGTATGSGGAATPSGGLSSGKEDDSGLSTGAVAAIVIGAVAAAGAVGAGAWYALRRSRPA